MSQQIFADSLDLLVESQRKNSNKTSLNLASSLSQSTSRKMLNKLVELYSEINTLKGRMKPDEAQIVSNEFQSFWAFFLKSSALCLDVDKENFLENLISPSFSQNFAAMNPSRKALDFEVKNKFFFEVSAFYHSNEDILFNASQEKEVTLILVDFEKKMRSNIRKMRNVTSEEVLDWVLFSDSFLLLLSRIMASLEESFDFDHQRIKNNFIHEFETRTKSSGLASRSKSRFLDPTDDAKFPEEEYTGTFM